MLILSVSEAKRQIKDLVEQTNLGNHVFYITRYSQPKAVILGVEQYEGLVRQVSQLQDDLARLWAAVDAPTDSDAPILLPTSDSSTRVFQPNRQITPDVRNAIRRAAQLAIAQGVRSPQQIVQDGRAALAEARQEAILSGQAIDDEGEGAVDD